MNLPAVPHAPKRTATSALAYRCRLARDEADVRAAQALRFAVFNLELREGIAQSWATGLDADRFDAVCDHLIVEDVAGGTVVGTYRLQSGVTAATAHGYYSEREFDFTPYEPLRREMIELGRACVHAAHRSVAVLNLLWNGIADYARARRARWLIGCSSLSTVDATVGAAAWRTLGAHLAPQALRTRPTEAFACPLDAAAPTTPKIPRLLAIYLALGAVVCGPPAIDREFRTVDFLTLADLRRVCARRAFPCQRA